MEMHMVHTKSTLKGDLTASLADKDGLKVIAILFHVGKYDNSVLDVSIKVSNENYINP